MFLGICGVPLGVVHTFIQANSNYENVYVISLALSPTSSKKANDFITADKKGEGQRKKCHARTSEGKILFFSPFPTTNLLITPRLALSGPLKGPVLYLYCGFRENCKQESSGTILTRSDTV